PVSTPLPYTTLFRSEEQRAAGDQEDLVPVPDRSDRLQDGAAGAVAAPPEGADVHLHPEVEALEHEVAQEEERDEEEPQGLEPGRDRKSTRLNSSHVS